MTRLAALVMMALVAQNAAAQDVIRGEGWVVLPVEDYRALRARAFPANPEPSPPPIDAALTRVDYNLRVAATGDSVTGQARLAARHAGRGRNDRAAGLWIGTLVGDAGGAPNRRGSGDRRWIDQRAG